jgi:hypothetical protein
MAYEGISFATNAPLIVRTATPNISIHMHGGDHFDIYTLDANNTIKEEVDNQAIGGDTGVVPWIQMQSLHWGWNRLCLVPHGGAVTTLETASCLEIAFLP